MVDSIFPERVSREAWMESSCIWGVIAHEAPMQEARRIDVNFLCIKSSIPS
jgi:hypothetical protein